VSVAAANALVADGLSTALSAVSPARCAAILHAYAPACAYLVGNDGRIARLSAL
jgi:thiamine biosynthesis lipoprotein ApbE